MNERSSKECIACIEQHSTNGAFYENEMFLSALFGTVATGHMKLVQLRGWIFYFILVNSSLSSYS